MTDVAERRAKLAEQEATNARLFAEEIAAARAKAEAALSEHGEVTVRLYGHVWQVVCGKRSVADETSIDGAIQQHLDIIARKAKPITHERPMPADPEPEAPKPPEPPPEVVKNAPEPEPVVEEEAMPLPPNPVEAKLSDYGEVGPKVSPELDALLNKGEDVADGKRRLLQEYDVLTNRLLSDNYQTNEVETKRHEEISAVLMELRS